MRLRYTRKRQRYTVWVREGKGRTGEKGRHLHVHDCSVFFAQGARTLCVPIEKHKGGQICGTPSLHILISFWFWGLSKALGTSVEGPRLSLGTSFVCTNGKSTPRKKQGEGEQRSGKRGFLAFYCCAAKRDFFREHSLSYPIHGCVCNLRAACSSEVK